MLQCWKEAARRLSRQLQETTSVLAKSCPCDKQNFLRRHLKKSGKPLYFDEVTI